MRKIYALKWEFGNWKTMESGMIGLIALLILFFWIYAIYQLSKFMVTVSKVTRRRKSIHCLLFMILFVAPLMDEIAGGFQFRSLCRKDNVTFVNEEKAKDKTLVEEYSSVKLSGYILPIEKAKFSFKDMDTDEVVVSWVQYSAIGGWFARNFSFGASNSPRTFNGTCRPEYSGMKIVHKLNIKLQSR